MSKRKKLTVSKEKKLGSRGLKGNADRIERDNEDKFEKE